MSLNALVQKSLFQKLDSHKHKYVHFLSLCNLLSQGVVHQNYWMLISLRSFENFRSIVGDRPQGVFYLEFVDL